MNRPPIGYPLPDGTYPGVPDMIETPMVPETSQEAPEGDISEDPLPTHYLGGDFLPSGFLDVPTTMVNHYFRRLAKKAVVERKVTRKIRRRQHWTKKLKYHRDWYASHRDRRIAKEARYRESLRGSYFYLRRLAKRRGIPWNLTVEEWTDFWQANGGSEALRLRAYGLQLQRIDKSKGYQLDNLRLVET